MTIGYVQSKLIRTPLPLNTDWNSSVNKCNSEKELMDFVCDNGTVEEVVRLRKLLTKVRQRKSLLEETKLNK